MTVTSSGNSLVVNENRELESTVLDSLICITSLCSAFSLLCALTCFFTFTVVEVRHCNG